MFVRTTGAQGDTLALAPDTLLLSSAVVQLSSRQGKRTLTVPADAEAALRGMPCLDAVHERYDDVLPAGGWLIDRFSKGDLRRVIAAEHTGLLDREEREALEARFKAPQPRRWYENLLSATPTLELGVDIGDLSSVLLCSVPPTQASYLQRVGRAGRRDGNALITTLAEGSSPHDLYFFEDVQEMIAGEVTPPGIFLRAAEVLRRQLAAFCLDDWVTTLTSATALPDKTSPALDAVERADRTRFPYTFTDHVLTNEPRLSQAFLDLLGTDIDDRVRERLTQFLQGTGDEDGLRVRLLKVLEELMEERKLHRKRAEQIKAQIAAVGQRPQDEATKDEIDKLRRERDKVLELVKEINQRDLLNTLTDAGLIPNYAFPEAGIELKSVLWRRKASDDHTPGAYVALPALRYERPASSALSEFAPENRFYANQRRVEIDQINMGLAKLEWWRLCAGCHHMENLQIHADAHETCPRCGDAMWPDQAQRRQLLRFRQAIANSDDTRVRIDDSADDREPKFYVRQLLADFEADDIKEAWRLNAPDVPFGFEFIARVTFRDVNFGELSKPGDTFSVADQSTARPGFTLCRHCGKVQTPQRTASQRNAPAQDHSFECAKRDSNDPADLVDCLYLYREFSSEALRILVPYTRAGMNDSVIQSFMAALQLGLKKRFGGRVDHLRMTLQDEPGRDGGPRRQYVVLYDSVPGGTGYLHQLLARDAGTLGDVLRMALDAINACGCRADPEKDGCYRCVYQYRLARQDGSRLARAGGPGTDGSRGRARQPGEGSHHLGYLHQSSLRLRARITIHREPAETGRRRRPATREAGAGDRVRQVGISARSWQRTLLGGAAARARRKRSRGRTVLPGFRSVAGQQPLGPQTHRRILRRLGIPSALASRGRAQAQRDRREPGVLGVVRDARRCEGGPGRRGDDRSRVAVDGDEPPQRRAGAPCGAPGGTARLQPERRGAVAQVAGARRWRADRSRRHAVEEKRGVGHVPDGADTGHSRGSIGQGRHGNPRGRPSRMDAGASAIQRPGRQPGGCASGGEILVARGIRPGVTGSRVDAWARHPER